jgi:hypothetical protein
MSADDVKPLLLNQLWHIINEMQTQTVLESNDPDLVEQLLKKLDQKIPLSLEDNCLVRTYLSSKTSLIRDLAYARLWRF